MTLGMSQQSPIKIFRPGTFTSMEGVSVNFSTPDLAAIAAAYDAARDPAPLVIGHPDLTAPAYGWVDALRIDDAGDLVAIPGRVEPAFAAAVNEGRYAKVSARFWPPTHPANPAPGQWSLQHVGFLGAAPPGVTGLGTASFAASDDPFATFTFDQEKDVTKTTDAASFAAQSAALDTRDAELTAREKQLADREAAAAKREADAIHAANVSFAAGLVAEAKLAKPGEALLVGVLDHLDATSSVSFSAGGETSPSAALKKLLSGAHPLVDLTERAPGKDAPTAVPASFAAPSGYEVNDDQAAIYNRAHELMAADPRLTLIGAAKRASAELAARG